MVLLLETAAALETRARRCTEPNQVRVLLQRAEQRRAESARIREWLAVHGGTVAPHEARLWAAVGRPPRTTAGGHPRLR